MGCDIHLFVEQMIDGRWVSVDQWEKVDNKKDNESGLYYHVPWGKEFYHDRDYKLFSLLADVRNHWELEPISDPKGQPNNLSPRVETMFDYYKGDGHSQSWYTLKELLDFDWTQKVKRYDEIDKKDYIIDYNEIYTNTGFDKTIEKLKLIEKDPEKIRIVFFFDN
jgi:hypothetical protein